MIKTTFSIAPDNATQWRVLRDVDVVAGGLTLDEAWDVALKNALDTEAAGDSCSIEWIGSATTLNMRTFRGDR
ncbi:hypothetical protein [Luteibacter sp.]|uniref:hypothetical protein n=1 Tax=Luteibacter sp. TaxID=1886636 RepID=UPI0025C3D75A|nr:hypothetical protein [Luteibacter sp.]